MRFNGVKCGLCPLVRSVEAARDEGWMLGVVDLCPVHSQSDGSDANTDLTQRALRPKSSLANDPTEAP